MSTTLIHFRPMKYTPGMSGTGNVRCLNGSAHTQETTDIKQVTCALCLNPNTFKDHWAIKQNEVRTKNQYSPITGLRFERFLNRL